MKLANSSSLDGFRPRIVGISSMSADVSTILQAIEAGDSKAQRSCSRSCMGSSGRWLQAHFLSSQPEVMRRILIDRR